MRTQSDRPADHVEELVQRHENRIYRAAVAIMGSHADAEDVMQDVFLKVMEKAPAFQSEGHEAAWLTKVTVNLCRSRLRSPWRKKREPLLDTYPAQDEEQRSLMETVLSLPPKYRAVIYLFYYEGRSTKEIAELIGQKEPTVRSLLTRARHMLRACLASRS
ncbi:MAG: RNA polymerase sigma factor [Clostridiales bacterium]|nr:RNA polymerase sigma factor [Clostridiales bacterium]